MVLIHGWSGSQVYFEQNRRQIAARCVVYTYDQRFHGESDKPAWVRRASPTGCPAPGPGAGGLEWLSRWEGSCSSCATKRGTKDMGIAAVCDVFALQNTA